MTSIRNRLTRKLVATQCLFLVGGFATVYFWARSALVSQFHATLLTKALAITSATEFRKDKVRVFFRDEVWESFDAQGTTDFFEVRKLDGTFVEHTEALGAAGTLPLPKNNPGTIQSPHFWKMQLPNGLSGEAMSFRFTPRSSAVLPGIAIPELTLVVAVDRTRLDDRLHSLNIIIISSGFLLLAATLVILPRILRTELQPLNRLGDQAAAINAESLSSRFLIEHVPSELLPITHRLNDLLARLEKSFERERRFSADLAHELRTPIAELRSLVEYTMKWPDSRDPATDADTLAIAKHMEGIVSRMLTLARSERGQIALHQETIDLADVIAAVWQPLGAKVEKKKIKARLNVSSVSVNTDQVLLRSIIGNLIENAVEYCPCRGELEIDITHTENLFKVSVSNSVENFGSADLENLFDRFWRKEASRTGEDHAGLGLALALAFSKALDFELTAALDGNGRLLFNLNGNRRALAIPATLIPV